MIIYPIENDIHELASLLSEYQDFVWLDSADGQGFSILAFGSSAVKKFTRNSNPVDFCKFLNQSNSERTTVRLCDHATMRKRESPSRTVAQSHSHSLNLHFTGGWIGAISYEAYQFNDLIPFNPSITKNYPLAIFRYYDSFIYINHYEGKKYFVSYSNEGEFKWQVLQDQMKNRKMRPKITDDFLVKDIKCNTNKNKYAEGFNEIKESLSSGDYFELNYTLEYNGQFLGNILTLYHRLRQITQAPMMAYLDFPEIKILSASPERFFKIEDNQIHTYPIKGTMKRGLTVEQDELNKKKLLKSAKDKAELLMVTDMLRNDLGRFCQTGSIKVEDLAKIHTFSHYHHLIANISGTLPENYRLSDVFFGLFPGGSITGAPKIKVMEQIDRLERRARGVYTGAIGYISNNGIVDFNIPIRTITIENDRLSFAAGGGIVADSSCEAEYEECLVKAAGLVEALKSCT